MRTNDTKPYRHVPFCLTILVVIGILLAMNAPADPVLKDVFRDDFLVGVALKPSQFCDYDEVEASIAKAQFDSISPENTLKWENVHPEPGTFDFSMADRYVDFGTSNQMFVIGHNLIWHSQTPQWVFEDDQGKPLTRDALLARMKDHIDTVVGRYKGRIGGWDVVNEALDNHGKLRTSHWQKIIGDDYIEKAFEFAHAADPQAELYYNDFGLEDPQKRKGAIELIQNLQSKGIKITGVGLQGHYSLHSPSIMQVDHTISDFEKLGIKVMITELDINVLPSWSETLDADISNRYKSSAAMDPYTNSLPDSVQQQLAQRYADLFGVFLKHRDSISRVTFWGVTDGDSWLNDYPIRGRTSYPLLFDRQGKPKPAFTAVVKSKLPKSAMLTPEAGSDPK